MILRTRNNKFISCLSIVCALCGLIGLWNHANIILNRPRPILPSSPLGDANSVTSFTKETVKPPNSSLQVNDVTVLRQRQVIDKPNYGSLAKREVGEHLETREKVDREATGDYDIEERDDEN